MTRREGRPLPPPRSRPTVVALSLLVALLLVVLGGVAVRDLAVTQDWTGGSPWLPEVVDAVGDQGRSTGATVLGAALVVVGLLALLATTGRGRRTHLPVDLPVDAWISPSAVAAIALEAADRAPGVLHAQVAGAGRRRVVIEVTAANRPRGHGALGDGSVAAGAQEAARAAVADVPGASVVVRDAGGAA